MERRESTVLVKVLMKVVIHEHGRHDLNDIWFERTRTIMQGVCVVQSATNQIHAISCKHRTINLSTKSLTAYINNASRFSHCSFSLFSFSISTSKKQTQSTLNKIKTVISLWSLLKIYLLKSTHICNTCSNVKFSNYWLYATNSGTKQPWSISTRYWLCVQETSDNLKETYLSTHKTKALILEVM